MNRYKLMVAVFIGCLFCFFTLHAMQVDIKTLVKEINNDMRSVEKMQAGATAAAKLSEIKSKIDKARSMEPNYFELRSLDTKYKRLVGLYGGQKSSPAPSSSTSATSTPSTEKAVDAGGKEQALKDWEGIVALKKDFIGRLGQVIPTFVKNIIYDGVHADDVIAKIAILRKEAPAVRTKVMAFSNTYGKTMDEIDKKIYGLTPKDSRLSLYDAKNERPSDSPGHCFNELVNGLTNLEEAPKIEAKRILTTVLQNLGSIESFTMDTARDKKYTEVEEKIQMGLRFNPDDQELKDWLLKIKALRVKSKVDIEKALDSARFPGPTGNFSGPGNMTDLAASCLKYFKEQGGNETTVAVNVAGNWVVAKRNIFSEPIQWGLPIWAVSYHNDEKEIARVFRLTILTDEGLNIAKQPPWTGVWVGDSYRMRTGNIK